MASNILITNGAQITKTGPQFDAYDQIKYSAEDPQYEVSLVISSGSADLSDELGTLAATVNGSGAPNTITTGGGDDHIYGGGSSDILSGGAGNDTIYGETGNDTINGGDDHDMLDGGAGNDTINGGDGNDTITDHEYNTVGVVAISSDGGDDNIAIQYYASDLTGTIDGGTGNDTLAAYGNLGAATISNVETLITQGGQISGTVGQFESFERIVYSNDPDPIFETPGYSVNLVLTNSGTADLASELGPRSSTVSASNLGNTIVTGDGQDTLYGGNGNDTLTGGKGADAVFGYAGNDTLNGGDGNDTLDGGAGNDTLNGGEGNDTITDYEFSTVGVIAISGDSGDDNIAIQYYSADLTGTIDGGTGDDTLTAYGILGRATISNVETLITGGSDILGTVEQFESFDKIVYLNDPIYDTPDYRLTLRLFNGGTVDLSDELGPRSTSIKAWDTGNAITTGSGDDDVNGNIGNDILNGGDGNDQLYGREGNDTLNGGDGNDTLDGGHGEDKINGGDGDDTITDDEFDFNGVVAISGGGGDDQINFLYYSNESELTGTIDGGTGNDILAAYGHLGTVTISNVETLITQGGSVSGTVEQFESFDKIVYLNDPKYDGPGYAVSLTLTNGGTADLADELGLLSAYITASEFGNSITTSSGRDYLYGGAGNDTLKGGAGDDYLYDFSGGIDTAVYSGVFGNYTIDVEDDTITSVAEGKDRLSGIEFAKFSNGIYDFSNNTFTEDFNTAPANIRLSSTRVSEDTKKWTTLGLFSAIDAEGDPLTYALTDNAGGKFAINGRRFVTSDTFDFETKTFHDITVAVSDGTATTEKTFRITVGDVLEAPVNSAPTNLSLTRSYIKENSAAVSSIGLFSAVDAEGNSIKWTLLDNADSFRVVGNKLQSTTSFDYEAIPDHELTITVQATDSLGLSTVQDFTIDIRNVYEAGDFLM